MAHDSNFPSNDSFLADFPAGLREEIRSIVDDAVVNALKLQGLTAGNGQGQIPINNGVVNTGLNAEKLGGNPPSAFAPANYMPTAVTGSSNGAMINTDKTKIDGIAPGAEVNQNAFSNVLVNGTVIQADSKTDTLEIVAGDNITIVADATNDRITLKVSGKVPSAGYADSAGSAGNAGTVGGLSVATARNDIPNQIARTDNSGYLQVGYINSNDGNEGNNANPARVWGTNGSDAYLRTYLTSALRVNYANSAGSAPANGGTSQNSNQLLVGGSATTFNWSGQVGQPTWLWGGNAPGNMYVYNPSNFNVNYAKSAGSVPWSGVVGAPANSGLIVDFTVPSTTTDVTLTGLNLDRNNVYAINFTFNGGSPQPSWNRLFINGDRTLAHYYMNSTSWIAGANAIFTYAHQTPNSFIGHLLFDGVKWTVEGICSNGGARNPFYWSATDANIKAVSIASLTISTEVANCIMAGSRLRIYKM